MSPLLAVRLLRPAVAGAGGSLRGSLRPWLDAALADPAKARLGAWW